MRVVLESCTSVEAMKRNYQKFLPEFLTESAPKAQNRKLAEKVIRLKTGDSQESKPLMEEVDSEDSDIIEIRRLAHG
jgi:hypothetical protein